MKRATLFVTAATMLVLAAMPARAQFQAPDVLKQVPEGSAMVLIIPKLSDVNTKLGKFMKDFGDAPDEMLTPVASILEEMGISKGVDMNGSAAIVMPTLQLMGEPRIYAIVPVGDAVSFMTNFESATPSDKSPGVLQVPIKGAPQGFMKMAGKYAIISDNEQVVAKQAGAEDAKKLITDAGQLGRDVMSGSDAILYINMTKVGPMLQPMVAMGMAQVQMQMENDPGMSAVMGGPELAKVTLQAYQQAISTFLLQSQAVVVGGSVSDAGFTFGSAAQFKKDSAPAKLFPTKAPAEVNLDRLPNKPYLFAMAMDNTAVDWDVMIKAMDEQFTSKLPADSPIADLVKTYVDTMKVMDEFTYGQFAWYPGEMGNPADMMNFSYVFGAKEPASAMGKYTSAMKKIAAAMDKLAAEGGEGMPKTKMTFHENDAEVAGRKVDRWEIKMDMPAEAMQGNPAATMMMQPWNTYMTATDDAMVMALSSSTDLMAETLKASDGSGKLGSANEMLALSRKGLPAGRFGEMYVDTGPIIKTWMGFMGLMMGGGAPPQVEVPKMPPLAIGMSAKDGAAGMTWHVPTKLIYGIRDYTKAQMAAAMGAAMGGPVMVEEAVEVEEAGEGGQGEVGAAAAGVAEVTDAKFKAQVLEAKTPVLVDFWATWCAPCKQQAPIVEDLAKDFKGQVSFMKLDVDNNDKTSKAYKIRAIPTLLLFKDGKVVETFVGLTSKDKLATAIRKHLAD